MDEINPQIEDFPARAINMPLGEIIKVLPTYLPILLMVYAPPG